MALFGLLQRRVVTRGARVGEHAADDMASVDGDHLPDDAWQQQPAARIDEAWKLMSLNMYGFVMAVPPAPAPEAGLRRLRCLDAHLSLWTPGIVTL